MIDPINNDRRPPVTPQLALRVAALGVVAFVLFGIIFFRLWYLQVLSGDQYLAQAQTNRVRVQPLPAPRGSILDRNGNVLVENRPAIVVRLKPEGLPDSEKQVAIAYGARVIARSKKHKGHQGPPVAVPPPPADLRPRLARLGRVLGIRVQTIQDRVIHGLFLAGYAPVVVKTDVSPAVQAYIVERQEQFPGVSVENTFLRSYPEHTLAAQLLGTASQISPDELKNKAYKGIKAGTVIGQNGIESTYDQFLRGQDGKERLLVDAAGNPRGSGLRQEPTPGLNVELTLDLGLQKVAQQAFFDVAGARSGAFVAMDPRQGNVLALGSFPTFDPNVLSGAISQKRYEAIFNTGTTPQFNRVIGAHYATGSTFKPVTALAALNAGKLTTTETIDDTGCIKIGTQPRCNALHEAFGSVDLRAALKVSSDIFFYTMGERTNRRNSDNAPIQKEARLLGFNRPTGIDLPGESGGLVPDTSWRLRVAQQEIDCRKQKKIAVDAPGAVAAAGGCGISDMRPWSIGDNVSLATGQGDLQATPLQLVTAYAGIVNGGKIPQPRLGRSVVDDQGLQVQPLPASTSRRVPIDSGYRDVIMQGLHDAASAPGGTSAPVFAGWNQSRFPVFGKTGTAEVPPKPDQAWYVAYSYDGTPDHKPIVLAVTVEDGGFGASTAAPIACRIMKAYFGARRNNRSAVCAAGSNATR